MGKSGNGNRTFGIFKDNKKIHNSAGMLFHQVEKRQNKKKKGRINRKYSSVDGDWWGISLSDYMLQFQGNLWSPLFQRNKTAKNNPWKVINCHITSTTEQKIATLGRRSFIIEMYKSTEKKLREQTVCGQIYLCRDIRVCCNMMELDKKDTRTRKCHYKKVAFFL